MSWSGEECNTGYGGLRFAIRAISLYSFVLQTRGGAVWQLVGLITRRS
jgi:hypothetical protein